MEFNESTVDVAAEWLRMKMGGFDEGFFLRFPNHKRWPDLDDPKKERWRIRARELLEVIANSIK